MHRKAEVSCGIIKISVFINLGAIFVIMYRFINCGQLTDLGFHISSSVVGQCLCKRYKKQREINIDWLLALCFSPPPMHLCLPSTPVTGHRLWLLVWNLILLQWLLAVPDDPDIIPGSDSNSELTLTCWQGLPTAPELCLCQYIWHVQSQLLAGESATQIAGFCTY